MLAKLFDVKDNVLIPTEHCYIITWLKDIMDAYQEDDEYLKVYAYIYYMTYPDSVANPYFNMSDMDKEPTILYDIDAEFSTEDDLILIALEKCREIYNTPISRAYECMKGMLDKLANFLKTASITTGRDGNMHQIVQAAKNFEAISRSFKGAYKDLQEEQQARIRGNKQRAYDQE
jgi:hypothetical protein